MTSRDRTIGVIEVINKREGIVRRARPEAGDGARSQAAVAIDNARLYARLADAVVTTRMSYPVFAE